MPPAPAEPEEAAGDRLVYALVGGLVLAVVGAGALLGLVALDPPASGLGNQPPEADWTLERVNDTHVRLTHAGGEPVPAAELIVTVDGYARSPDWPEFVTEDTGAVLRASPGQRVRLYWTGGEGDRSLLADWVVGGNRTGA